MSAAGEHRDATLAAIAQITDYVAALTAVRAVGLDALRALHVVTAGSPHTSAETAMNTLTGSTMEAARAIRLATKAAEEALIYSDVL